LTQAEIKDLQQAIDLRLIILQVCQVYEHIPILKPLSAKNQSM